jgi:hypothetical protein
MRSFVLLCGWLWVASAHAQDADADGIPDSVEQPFGDSDADGTPNSLDPDDDGDTRPTLVEGGGDRDGDGTPDYLDGDEDDDGLALLAEDVNGDGMLSALDDTDGDGWIDALDADDDGDGLETRFELGASLALDTDGDGRPDSRDADDDGDGASTLEERAVDANADADLDGLPAYLDANELGRRKLSADLDGDGIEDDRDADVDGDGVLDAEERAGDSDGDGLVDARDPDDDGDGVETVREARDTDGDELLDYLEVDDDDDGIPTRDEEPDRNRDGIADDPRTTAGVPDYLTADDDNDGVSTRLEGATADSDADGTPDHRDADDDGDGVETQWEAPNGVDRDTDGDGRLDRVDSDDDGDSLATALECTRVRSQDVDGDGAWNCYDLDADGDGASDAMEGTLDTDDDGLPDFLDDTATPKDTDHDGVADVLECELPLLGCPDVDGDGLADPLDEDDDGDGLLTTVEQGDNDGDGTPDYLDDDDDEDGVLTRLEARADSDADGVPDHLDADDDGDGRSTRSEGAVDSDADGLPDYLDAEHSGPTDAGVQPEAGVSSFDGAVVPLGTRARTRDGCALAEAPHSALSCLLVLAMAALSRRRLALAALLAGGCVEDAPRATLSLDAAVPLDAARAPDASVERCTSSELSFSTGDTSARSFSAVVQQNRIELAFIAPSCGGATSLGQGKGVRVVRFSTRGAPDEPLALDDEDCLPLREPTLSREGALYFTSARDGQLDLYVAGPTPRKLTSDSALELELNASMLGDVPAVAFVKQAALASVEPASIQLLANGMSRELLAATAGHHPVQLTLQGPLLGWRSDSQAAQGLYMRALDERGQPAADVVTLTRQIGTRSALAFAGDAVVYSEWSSDTHMLRYRTSGGEVRPLTAANQDVQQFAVAPYRNGYAVAYRNREPNGEFTLRLLSVDAQGIVAANTTFASPSSDGTHVQLLRAQDGRLLVFWDESRPAPADGGLPDFNRLLRVGRISCI